MQEAPRNHEFCRVIAVRADGGEVVLAQHIHEARAESVRDALIDSRAFADIRVEVEAPRPGPRQSKARQTQAL